MRLGGDAQQEGNPIVDDQVYQFRFQGFDTGCFCEIKYPVQALPVKKHSGRKTVERESDPVFISLPVS